jgi:hypothetical protein
MAERDKLTRKIIIFLYRAMNVWRQRDLRLDSFFFVKQSKLNRSTSYKWGGTTIFVTTGMNANPAIRFAVLVMACRCSLSWNCVAKNVSCIAGGACVHRQESSDQVCILLQFSG